MKRTLVIALVAAVAVAGTSFAYAAIPSANGTISACKDSKGSLKVIDAEGGQTCNGNQQLLSWNQQGPAGQDGVSGYERVYKESTSNSTGSKTESVFCPSGKMALGGGAGVYGPFVGGGQLIVDGVALVQSHPFNEYGWGARADELVPTDDDWHLSVWVICADVS